MCALVYYRDTECNAEFCTSVSWSPTLAEQISSIEAANFTQRPKFLDARPAKTIFFFPIAGVSNVMTQPLSPRQGAAAVGTAACNTQTAQITRHSCVHLVLPCISTVLPCSLWSKHHANLLFLVAKTSMVAFVWDHCMTVKKRRHISSHSLRRELDYGNLLHKNWAFLFRDVVDASSVARKCR